MKKSTIFILALGFLAYLFFKEGGAGERKLTESEKRGYKEGLGIA